jgi:hypothetical protein
MGYINVTTGGSFVGQYGLTSVTEQFVALDHGHADAVARAIEYLAEVVLPRATALDHELHEQGEKPRKGFTPDRITMPVET